MRTIIPLAIGGLLVVLLIQERVPAQERKSLEARVLDLEKKVAALEKKAEWNKDRIVKYHKLEVKSIEQVKWKKLKKGMTVKQVDALLGKPNARATTRWVYRYEHIAGYILFKNGVVESWREPNWDAAE